LLGSAQQELSWFIANVNDDGTFSDHTYYIDGLQAMAPSYPLADDSSVSTFLAAAGQFARASSDLSFFQSSDVRAKLERSNSALLHMVQPDGLTTSFLNPPSTDTPKTSYLEANVESYLGFLGMSFIESYVYHDSALAQVDANAAAGVKAGILSDLYDSNTGIFKISLGASTAPGVWNPGASGLAWPIIFGLIDPGSQIAQSQIQTIASTWDGSSRMKWTGRSDAGFVAIAALMTGHTQDAAAAFAQLDHLPLPSFILSPNQAGTQTHPQDIGLTTVADVGALMRLMAPIAGNVSVATAYETSVTLAVRPLDFDLNTPSANLAVAIPNQPLGGTATVLSDGRIKFVPNVGFSGTVVFAYTATDTAGVAGTGWVTVTVAPGASPSSVTVLSAFSPATFKVSWSGNGASGGAGVATYDVYVSDNGGAFTVFKSSTTQTSATFTGQDGHTYGFYSVATEIDGDTQTPPIAAQSTTLVDGTPPSSSVAALSNFNAASFTVSWSGQDSSSGAGVASFSIYYSDNGGPFTLWQSATSQKSAVFSGLDGHSYGFYSVATDNVGNIQSTPGAAQALTKVDSTPPNSKVSDLAALENSPSFALSWSGTDVGSGVAAYTVYFSDNGAPFTPFLVNTTQISAIFNGQDGHRYGFYSVATDKVGNLEASPSGSQTTTTVDSTAPDSSVEVLPMLSKPAFQVTWSGTDNQNGSGIASFTILVSDNGGAFLPFLTGTTLTSATFSGKGEHKYAFISVATDNAGNIQTTPSIAQATTQALLDTPNKQFVAAVYQALLLRSTDVSGLNFWSGLLETGQSRGIVSQGLDHSAEYFQTNIIKPAYLEFLNREADAGGMAYWTAQLQAGITDEQMQAGFIASPEFYAKANGSTTPVPRSTAADKLYVDAIYQTLLDRSASTTDEDYWVNQIQGNLSLLQLANAFTGSKEGLSLRVQQTYQRFLGRQADDGGLAFWLSRYARGATDEDIITGFIASDEFFKQATT
jgi:hypothetical protein